MSYQTRKKIYKKIEQIRKRPLIAYVTTIKPGHNVGMAGDIIPYLINQINKIKDSDSIDFLILSNGGDPLVPWHIMSILRERFKNITILVPYTAYSAATILALGADEILMHPYANLGPIDPQLSFPIEKGKIKTIGYEDIIKYIDFIKDISNNNQEILSSSLEKLTNELPPTLIGFAKRSDSLGKVICEKLLHTHMQDETKIKNIIEVLNNNYYHHSYPLSRYEARQIGLPITKSNQEIEDLLWNLYEDYSNEMTFNIPYNPELIIMDEVEKNQFLKPNTINITKSKSIIACLESTKINNYIEEEIIARYQLNNDMTIASNISIKPGTWKTEITPN